MGTRALEALGVGIFVGAALGGPLFGRNADSRGRRSALLLSMSLSLLGLAMTNGYHVVVARVAWKVSWAFGLAPQIGWRVTYLTISGLVLYVGVLRFGLPESPRWLASVGRVEEALLVVEKLERAHGHRTSYSKIPLLGDPTAMSTLPTAKVLPVVNLSVHTFVLWILWSAMALSAYALASASSLVLGEFDRKQALAAFATSAAVVAVLTSHAPWNGPIVVVGLSAFIAANWSCVLVYAPENFSTEYRGRGVGYVFGFSRLGATIGFLLCPQTSVPAIAWIFAVLLVRVVFGIVLPYGRNKLREDEGDLDSQRTCRLFSSLSVEEGIPLVSSSSSKTATYNV
ncbi:hypothetical protein PF011_g14279 [Phytophthora fragariae]|uniref:Major facilitator superfamily (MFS) profile domain-containing protein n=1 Tax=Phytophthora fragariae TaxID=53985 RepID=A0A6A3JY52_9STRA|nr:hypothetical protein PF011_g14279 [Phytophthora fragariae]